ncbi:MAG: bacterial transcriptional activator domain-containing protein [Gammaproteobacteria bacterium]|nr:bacterial transcriptional activator domain-containing protein [Gammaproteobacteria bacterium]
MNNKNITEQNAYYIELKTQILGMLEQEEYDQALEFLSCAGKRNNKAKRFIPSSRESVNQFSHSFLEYIIFLLLAELAFTYSDDTQGLDTLARALSVGRQHNYFNFDCLSPDTMCELCIQALRYNIEVDYVQLLIKRQKLKPQSPPFDVKLWPWELKIYTLGRFSILLNGVPLNITGKGQGKPVEFLKALVALGGRDVSEPDLCEVLWPDSEGDQAHSAFTTTLSRCRKLIGKQLLLFHNGHLSLSDHQCWVDSWAFERCLGELESMLGHNDPQFKQQIQYKVDSLFELYHGLFMEKEPQLGWILPYRERLNTKFLRLIKQLVHYYSRAGGQCKKVITLYEKARELDPMSEQYCRGLMRCHAAQGNRSEALAIFDRCHTMLITAFGIEPSNKTKELYQLIKTGDPQQLLNFCDVCSQTVNQ